MPFTTRYFIVSINIRVEFSIVVKCELTYCRFLVCMNFNFLFKVVFFTHQLIISTVRVNNYFISILIILVTRINIYNFHKYTRHFFTCMFKCDSVFSALLKEELIRPTDIVIMVKQHISENDAQSCDNLDDIKLHILMR